MILGMRAGEGGAVRTLLVISTRLPASSTVFCGGIHRPVTPTLPHPILPCPSLPSAVAFLACLGRKRWKGTRESSCSSAVGCGMWLMTMMGLALSKQTDDDDDDLRTSFPSTHPEISKYVARPHSEGEKKEEEERRCCHYHRRVVMVSIWPSPLKLNSHPAALGAPPACRRLACRASWGYPAAVLCCHRTRTAP